MAPSASIPTFEHALDAAASQPAPELLQRLRTRGRNRFDTLGMPGRREEAWRFTRLKDIEETVFHAPPLLPSRVDVTPWRSPGSHLMVFVDGVYSPDLSAVGDLPDGVVVSNLLLATASGSEVVSAHLGAQATMEDHPFAALNTALLSDGAVIVLPETAELEQPIQLLFVTAHAGRPTVLAPRLLVVAGERSRATIEEHHVGRSGSALTCPVTEIEVGADAALRHVVVQDLPREASFLATRHIRIARNGRYSSQSISLGGSLARTDVAAVLAGEGAEAILDGLYLTDGRQQADSHLTVRHAAPHCQSHQLYKGILAGSSRAVFNGRIIVDQDAQKTDARQANRNLVLSDAAVANSNPQLEIFADDVRCTHGSTVGRLDEDAVFYLRSRGISADEARRMLTLAFAGEVLDRIPLTELRERLETQVAERLGSIEREGGPA